MFGLSERLSERLIQKVKSPTLVGCLLQYPFTDEHSKATHNNIDTPTTSVNKLSVQVR